MFSLRNELWTYPEAVIPLIKRYQVTLYIFISIVFGVSIAFGASFIFTLQKANVFNEKVYSEGYIGDALTIDPLLQTRTAYEKEISQLVFSSLVKIDASGKIFPDLSETWTISSDGKSYTFYLRKGVYWHDGVEFTSEDVKTTYELIKAGGPKFANGNILKDININTPNKYEIEFKLPQSNSSFLELLSVGIVPSHIFSGYTYSRYINEVPDMTPIGTGPYKYSQQSKNVFTFKANPQYFLGKTQIDTLLLKQYSSNEEARAALLQGDIYTLVNISPRDVNFFGKYKTLLTKKYELYNNTRMVYFNLITNKATLSKNVRQAIAYAVDKLEIQQQIPGAEIAYGPYAPQSWVYNSDIEYLFSTDLNKAKALLEQDGWKLPKESTETTRFKNNVPLHLTVTYLDTETNSLIANLLKQYGESIGVNIEPKPVTREDLIQEVLPQRDFEMLIFEVQTSMDPDLYTLWHSSQAKYPGLNISGYASNRADGFLEKGRIITDRDKRFTYYQDFQEQLVNDVPAIFLYHPPLYTVGFDIIKSAEKTEMVLPGQRLTSLPQWVIEPRWRNWQTR